MKSALFEFFLRRTMELELLTNDVRFVLIRRIERHGSEVPIPSRGGDKIPRHRFLSSIVQHTVARAYLSIYISQVNW